MIAHEIAATISAEREKLGITQSDLARSLEVSLRTVQNLEKGNHLKIETVEKALAFFGRRLTIV